MPWVLLSYSMLSSGVFSLNLEQQSYFDSLSTFDYTLSILTGVVGLLGAITLFLLRKIAFYLFSASLAINILLTASHILTKGWMAAMPKGGAFGAFVGMGLLLAICLYSQNLIKKGILS